MLDPNWYGLPVKTGRVVQRKSSFGWLFSHDEYLQPVKVHAYKNQVVYPDYSNTHYCCYCRLACKLPIMLKYKKPKD